MRQEQILVNDKGVIKRATITWYDDWFDKYKKNEECKIFDIMFDVDDVPKNLRPEQIKKVYEEGRDIFREKFGIDIEDYSKIGSPSFLTINSSDIKEGIKNYCLREYELLNLDDNRCFQNRYEKDICDIIKKYGWLCAVDDE